VRVVTDAVKWCLL